MQPSQFDAAGQTPGQTSLPPDTTKQQDINTAGQRRVNMLWEWTQAIIAITVVLTTMMTAVFMILNKDMDQIPTIFSFAFGTVVGFYFSRTNHQVIDGTGEKPIQPYQGR